MRTALPFIFVTIIVAFFISSLESTNVIEGSYSAVSIAHASSHNTSPGTGPPPGTNPGSGSAPEWLLNPLKFESIECFLIAVIEVILIFARPLIVLFIMYAGFLYVTAGGDEGKVTTARKALTWAIVGGLIVLGATVIMEVIGGTIGSFGGEEGGSPSCGS